MKGVECTPEDTEVLVCPIQNDSDNSTHEWSQECHKKGVEYTKGEGGSSANIKSFRRFPRQRCCFGGTTSCMELPRLSLYVRGLISCNNTVLLCVKLQKAFPSSA